MNRLAAVNLLLLSALTAQTADAERQSFGVTTHEGVVRGLGPDYSARFEAHGVTFTPALGNRVEVPQTLQFTVTSVRRGPTAVWHRAGGIAPTVVGDTVRYQHTNALCETYDVRADGIEQSFVFAARPAGSGDLVVRGEITTDLPLVHAGDDGVRFERADAGGVSFGEVTGIDANGARCRGSLRCTGKAMELVLPGEFVDSATYPLVLDPLIGSAFTVGNAAGGSDVQPAVAFDATTSRYLVVWNVNLSATVAEVRAQLVSATGTLAGNQMLLTSIGNPAERPVVGNINISDRFLVAYVISTSTTTPVGTFYFDVLRAVAITAGTGAVSSSLTVAGGLLQEQPSQPAIGGDSQAFFGPATALIVHRSAGVATNSIVAQRVQVLSLGTPSLNYTTILATSSNRLGDPAVSAQAGNNGSWLVAFGQSTVSLTAPLTRIYGQRFDYTGGPCGAPITLLNAGAGGDLRQPTIASPDGDTFAVAWHDAIAQRINLRMLVWTGTCTSGSWSTGLLQYPIVQAGPASSPSLAFAKDKYLLTWSQTVASVAKVYCKGLDPANCSSCGAELRTDTTVSADVTPAVASRWDGGDSASDEALVVWSNGTIRARRFEARGTGGIQSLGGGCFLGGFNDVNTYSGRPVLGDSTFALELAAPSAPIAALVIGFSAINFPCGSCTLVPALDLVLAGVSPTPVPIPCSPGLIGTELYTQWLLLKPSDCPLVPFFANSNTLKFTIAE